MRAGLFFATLTFSQVLAVGTYSQNARITLNLKNTPLKEVIHVIESQSNAYFMYDATIVDVNQKIDVSANDKPLSETLEDVFENTSIAFRINDSQIALSKMSSENFNLEQEEEQKQVEGTVTNKEGEPIPGVNVVIKGSSTGTITSIDGKYLINASPSDILVFSFIGMLTEEITVNNQTNITVEMIDDITQMEEVIAIGYSTATRNELTSAISTISSEELDGVSSAGVGQMIQGKASGVFVTNSSGRSGSMPKIRIRGSGSISTDDSDDDMVRSDPLYVVDGIIGDVADPNDIESITILKDAAATGLYGSRAANGVIVITTKRGKVGKPQFNVKAKGGFTKMNHGNLEMMNSAELYAFQETIYRYDYERNDGGFATLQEYMDSKGRPRSLLETDIDWNDYAYRIGSMQEYDVSSSGGSKEIKYYVAGNYYKERGTAIGDAYERFSARANLDFALSEKVNVQVNLKGRHENRENNSGDAVSRSISNMPWDNPYGPDGELQNGANKDTWTGKNLENFLHPLQWNYDHEIENRFYSDIKISWDILSWLSFSTTNRALYQFGRSEEYWDRRTIEGAEFGYEDPMTGETIGGGGLENNNDSRINLLTSNLLKANKSFNLHTISGIIGYEFNSNKDAFTTAVGAGIAPGTSTINATARPFSMDGEKSNYKFVSFLSQLNYSYNNRYIVVGSFRRDGSSKFGANNRFGNFYSLGLSWLVSQEDFMQNLNAISNLKLRGSYGVIGNAEGEYNHMQVYYVTQTFNDQPAAMPIFPPNPDLTWEYGHNTNLGFDLGLYKRIDFSFDFYNIENKGLLQRVPLQITSGYSHIDKNVGSVLNRGFEFALNTKNLTGDFSWETNFNITFNKNTVLELNEGVDIIDEREILREGESPYAFWVRKWMGVDPENGDPQYEVLIEDSLGNVIGSELTNNYNLATPQIVGTADPDFYGGIRNTLSYKGIQLDFHLNFVYGNSVFNGNRVRFSSDGAYVDYNQIKLPEGRSRWEQPGDNATDPKPLVGGNLNSYQSSSRQLEDGSYIRLVNVTLSYNVPKSFLSKIKMQGARLYVSGDNLFTITEFSGRDPEASLRGYPSNYAVPRRILFGVDIKL